MSSYHLDHLEYLEAEAIHVLREVAAEFERPAILFSGGPAPAANICPPVGFATPADRQELVSLNDRRSFFPVAKIRSAFCDSPRRLFDHPKFRCRFLMSRRVMSFQS